MTAGLRVDTLHLSSATHREAHGSDYNNARCCNRRQMPTAGRIVNGNGCSAIRTNWFSSRRRFPRHFRPSLISIGPFSNSDCRSLCSVLVVDPFAPAFAVCCCSRYPTTYVRRNVHATDWLDDFNLNAHSFEYVKEDTVGNACALARTHARTHRRTDNPKT